jgi:tetratricopeptide (TPR) repeat protein
MSTDQKSDIPKSLDQIEVKCHYIYEPTISQTQLVIDVPDDAKLSNELSVLIEKLRHPDNSLTTKQEELYEHLVATIPSTEVNRSIAARPSLERRNVVIKITKSAEEKKDPFGKMNNNLAPVVNYFKGRRLEELRQKIDNLRKDNAGLILCAVTGVAGCGKSEVAKVYAWELSAASDVFKWRLDPDPDASQNNASNVSYQQAFFLLLQNFNLHFLKPEAFETSNQFHERLVSMLWNKINQFYSWIVIFDNAGSYDDIVSYLPVDSGIKGIILITTQQSVFLIRNKEANFSLNNGLHEIEAIQLLKELSGRLQEDYVITQNLVQQLDYSPLAITVAGGYLSNVPDTTFERYAQILKSNFHEQCIHRIGGGSFISQLTQDRKRRTTLEGALKISIKRVEESNSLLIKVLQYTAYLANDNIPMELLVELCRNSEDKKEDVEETLKILIIGQGNYSLLSYDQGKKTCSLHRTTHLVLKNLSQQENVLRKTDYTSFLNNMLTAINKCIAHHLGLDSFNISQKLQLGVHLKVFLSNPLVYPSLNQEIDLTKSYEYLGIISDNKGEYLEALDYKLRNLQFYEERNLLREQTKTMDSLGYTYRNMSQYSLALDYFNRSLDLKRQLNIDMEIVDSLNAIGLLYTSIFDWSKAFDFQYQALGYECLLGDRQRLSNRMNNIGYIYRDKYVHNNYKDVNDLNSAKVWFQRAMAIRETFLDSSKSTYLGLSYHNVGECYMWIRKPSIAISYLQKSLDIIEKMSDDYKKAQDRAYGQLLYNMGLTYYDLKQYDKAGDFLRRSYNYYLNRNDSRFLKKIGKRLSDVNNAIKNSI